MLKLPFMTSTRYDVPHSCTQVWSTTRIEEYDATLILSPPKIRVHPTQIASQHDITTSGVVQSCIEPNPRNTKRLNSWRHSFVSRSNGCFRLILCLRARMLYLPARTKCCEPSYCVCVSGFHGFKIQDPPAHQQACKFVLLTLCYCSATAATCLLHIQEVLFSQKPSFELIKNEIDAYYCRNAWPTLQPFNGIRCTQVEDAPQLPRWNWFAWDVKKLLLASIILRLNPHINS